MTEETTTSPESEEIQMNDGLLVEFSPKRQITRTVSFAEGEMPSVRFNFRNGEFRVFTVPVEMLLRFAAHGASQKIGDAAAGGDDLLDAIAKIDETIDNLYSGRWNAVRGVGTGVAGVGLLGMALVRHTGKTSAQVREFLSGKDRKAQAKLRSIPAIAAIIEQLKAERPSSKKKSAETGPDAADMLQELGAAE